VEICVPFESSAIRKKRKKNSMTKYWTVLVTASLATLLATFAPMPVARADIFEWEYINPANPSLGKQQSTILTPDGAGADAAPGTNLTNRDLTKAYLIGANVSPDLVYDQYGYVVSYVASNLTAVTLSQADLTNAYFGGADGVNVSEEFTFYPGADLTDANLSQANATNANFYLATLTGANLSQADLTNANFLVAMLTDADFTGAGVRGANFDNVSGAGITTSQLYSTASYQAHDLTGIRLRGNNLAGVNLAGQNLTNATIDGATMTGANLTGAEVRGAYLSEISTAQLYSTASYKAHDLTRIRLNVGNFSGVNLAGQNLTNAQIPFATLTGANLSQANLTNANFISATLTGANLSQANLQNANFSTVVYCDDGGCTDPGDLTNANLSGADARGANFQYAVLTGANTSNLIQTYRHILGLDLTAGASLVIRDYENYAGVGIPIVVDEHLAMDGTGALRLVFDADPWDSTISFAPGIPVALGGTLELTFAPGVNIATQSGRTIDLFDWTGVTPTGAFTVSSPYTWNLSNLYTTGEITITALSALTGDYSGNGTVGPEDYKLWKSNFGSTTILAADGNGDGIVNAADYTVWRNNLGATLGSGGGAALPSAASLSPAVPEPASLALLALGLPLIVGRKSRGFGSGGTRGEPDPWASCSVRTIDSRGRSCWPNRAAMPTPVR
jgi:uncharacterized protein YjbI with pentapeptide repeats